MLALIRVEVFFVVCCVGVKNCCESLCDTCVDLSVTGMVNQRVFVVVKLCVGFAKYHDCLSCVPTRRSVEWRADLMSIVES